MGHSTMTACIKKACVDADRRKDVIDADRRKNVWAYSIALRSALRANPQQALGILEGHTKLIVAEYIAGPMSKEEAKAFNEKGFLNLEMQHH